MGADAILVRVEALDAIRTVLLGRGDVLLAYVFGSAARDQTRPSSDLDIAVVFERPLGARELDRLATALEAAAGRRVGLVTLETAPPLLAHEVIATGRLVLCRDEDLRVGFEARVAARYLDSARLRRVQHAYLRERAEAHRAGSS